MFTWKVGDDIRGFLNGCDMDPDDTKGYAYWVSRSEDVTDQYSFKVGSGINDWEDADGTTVDELCIWYQRLSPLQVWQFYIQGGTVPWRGSVINIAMNGGIQDFWNINQVHYIVQLK